MVQALNVCLLVLFTVLAVDFGFARSPEDLALIRKMMETRKYIENSMISSVKDDIKFTIKSCDKLFFECNTDADCGCPKRLVCREFDLNRKGTKTPRCILATFYEPN